MYSCIFNLENIRTKAKRNPVSYSDLESFIIDESLKNWNLAKKNQTLPDEKEIRSTARK